MKRSAVISLLLVLCLLLSNVGPALALTVGDVTGDGNINYLALGGAVSAGHGLNGAPAYPSLVADALGGNVKLNDLSIDGGIRIEELRVLLQDGFYGDSYTTANFITLADRRAEFQNAVKNADLITLDIGGDNFGKFIAQQVESGFTAYDANLNQVLSGNDVQTYAIAKSILVTMLGKEWGISNDASTQAMLDSLTYALMSYIVGFDTVIGQIKALNPNAQIVVVALSYPLTGLELPIDSSIVSDDDILASMVDIANLYASSEADHAGSYLFAYAENGVETMKEAVAGVSNANYLYPTAAGHVALKDAVVKAINQDIKGRQYRGVFMKAVSIHMLGEEARNPEEASKGDYVGDNTSYVAIGDGASVTGGVTNPTVKHPRDYEYGINFTKTLADKLGVGYTNLAQVGAFAKDSLSLLDSQSAVLKEADLVTLSYSLNTITSAAVEDMKKKPTGGSVTVLDWTEYLDPTSIETLNDMLDNMRQELIDRGLGGHNVMLKMSPADAMMIIIERYIFEVVAHINNYPLLVQGIQELNPEATVVLVGMYNPMEGVDLTFEDMEMPLADYMDMLTSFINGHYQLYAMTHENVVFVESEEMETAYHAKGNAPMGLVNYMYRLSQLGPVEHQATDASHNALAQKIAASLSVRKEEEQPPVTPDPPKPPVEQWEKGDVDHNGKVDNIDALKILQYSVGLTVNGTFDVELADYNGDGGVNNIDALMVLQKSVGLI